MKKIELGLKTGIALPLLATLIVGMTALLIFNYIIQINILKEEEKRIIESAVNTTKNFLEAANFHYQQMAALVANMPDVQEALYKKDRNRLLDKFLPSFNYLKEQFGVAQFHFHVPPAISLLRLHEPSNYGDDISQNRKTVVQVEATKKGVKGLEIGLGGVGLRGVEPIFYKENYVGSVDFGGGLQRELEIIKKTIGADVGVVLYKSALSPWIGLKDTKITIGDFVALNSTLQDPKSFLFEYSLKNAAKSQDIYVEHVSQAAKDFLVIYSPLKDFSGKIVGFIYIVKERILAPSKLLTILAVNVTVYVVILIVVALLIGYGMNKYVINPIITLTKMADDISMGKTTQKVEIKDARGEIAVLVKAIERMRVTMKKLLE